MNVHWWLSWAANADRGEGQGSKEEMLNPNQKGREMQKVGRVSGKFQD